MTGIFFKEESLQLWLVFSDSHLPWHNPKKMELIFYIARDIGVTHILIGGDFLDFYNINAHGPKDPQIATKLDDEFQSGVDMLSYMRAFFGDEVEIVFCAGNHEHRLNRFVMANCPAFYNHLTIEKMLQLDYYKIPYYQYNQPYWVTRDLVFQHSPPSYSQNAARTSMVKKMDLDHIYGCTHRPDDSPMTGGSGREYRTICLGWLGQLDIIKKNIREMPENRRVYQFTKNHESWGSSIALVTVMGKKHSAQHIVIKKDEKGKVFCTVGANYYEL